MINNNSLYYNKGSALANNRNLFYLKLFKLSQFTHKSRINCKYTVYFLFLNIIKIF